MELKGFDRVTLEPGEKTTVTFQVTPDDLSLLDINLKKTLEPGIFEIMVGGSSADIRQRGNITVK